MLDAMLDEVGNTDGTCEATKACTNPPTFRLVDPRGVTIQVCDTCLIHFKYRTGARARTCGMFVPCPNFCFTINTCLSTNTQVTGLPVTLQQTSDVVFQAGTSNGVASFSDIRLNLVGSYTFTAGIPSGYMLEETATWSAQVYAGPPSSIHWKANLTGCRATEHCSVGDRRMFVVYDAGGNELSAYVVLVQALRDESDVGEFLSLPADECKKSGTSFRCDAMMRYTYHCVAPARLACKACFKETRITYLDAPRT